MRNLSCLSIAVVVSVLSTPTAFGLILPFGQEQIAAAGAGCVAGCSADHASCTAYFHGNTALLNECLESLAEGNRHVRPFKVILHVGTFEVDDPEETLVTDADHAAPIAVDWSVRKSCLAEKVLAGTCRHDQREIVVDIWVANEIKLDDLRVPSVFKVESAGEIEQFVKRHANRQ